ncbi:hypothetical protein [Larkinella soli]|uniref:hypothetical protein n=1 Tax=Larkinella soli TaxID=1770527 RepID=UPI000FFB2FBE|nr:hypothetical protein [Larkinella soli]
MTPDHQQRYNPHADLQPNRYRGMLPRPAGLVAFVVQAAHQPQATVYCYPEALERKIAHYEATGHRILSRPQTKTKPRRRG